MVMATFVCLDNAPDGFGDKVTQSRNRQNAVDLEDFAALDERQAVWQQTLRMAGIEYIVKHGQDDAPPSPTSFSARELAPFLACTVTTSDWQDYLVAAKSDKKRLFGREGLVPATDPLRQSYEAPRRFVWKPTSIIGPDSRAVWTVMGGCRERWS